ncbi:ABC transporter substrate-binding protein [Limobrevibacterium gyesilva]|uniref:ABC transporter substrate-binding protein n=1 Tax=Limobrevibacterium gyesilva TaxID=2991712 RepID=A0AA41YNS4_9PROT|nr:ABC transporter substrate-binding protein [Limobrevibacterium gyesilva]MCW3477291.1 ABC transporter substrate-binding protein [Limobrevibacterium gyesilva]
MRPPVSIGRRRLLTGAAAIAVAPQARAQDRAVVIAQTSDVATLDPAYGMDTATGNVLKHIYESVLSRRGDGSIGPGAAGPAVNLSPTEWRVELPAGRRFANGEPVDAEAVRASFARIVDPAAKAPTRPLFTKIVEAIVESPGAIRFRTDGPDALFEARMTNLLVVPPKYAATGKLTEAPVGSGPYMLEQWRRNDAVVLTARPDSGLPAPHYTRVTFRAIPEEIARISAVKTGEAQLVTALSPNQADSIARGGGVQVLRSDSTRVMVVHFNTAVPPADDLRFRRAVAMAVNRDEIIRGLMKGYATPVATIFGAAVQGVQKGADGAFAHDPEAARKLIQELGLTGHEIEIAGGAGRYPLDREIALAVGAQLRRVGLAVKVRATEYGTFLGDVKQRRVAPVFIQPHGNVWFDPLPQLVAFFDSNGFISAWREPALDRLLTETDGALGAAREQLVGKIVTHLKDEAAAVPLFAYQFIYAAAPGLQWRPRPDDVILAQEMT